MDKDPVELRRRAAELRLTAGHAERAKDAQAELRRAADLERQADALEGRTPPAPPPREVVEEQSRQAQARRDAKLAKHVAAIKHRFRS